MVTIQRDAQFDRYDFSTRRSGQQQGVDEQQQAASGQQWNPFNARPIDGSSNTDSISLNSDNSGFRYQIPETNRPTGDSGNDQQSDQANSENARRSTQEGRQAASTERESQAQDTERSNQRVTSGVQRFGETLTALRDMTNGNGGLPQLSLSSSPIGNDSNAEFNPENSVFANRGNGNVEEARRVVTQASGQVANQTQEIGALGQEANAMANASQQSFGDSLALYGTSAMKIAQGIQQIQAGYAMLASGSFTFGAGTAAGLAMIAKGVQGVASGVQTAMQGGQRAAEAGEQGEQSASTFTAAERNVSDTGEYLGETQEVVASLLEGDDSNRNVSQLQNRDNAEDDNEREDSDEDRTDGSDNRRENNSPTRQENSVVASSATSVNTTSVNSSVTPRQARQISAPTGRQTAA